MIELNMKKIMNFSAITLRFYKRSKQIASVNER